MTLAYDAQVLLVTWNKAATPHSLYNCTVIQLSEEVPGHHVTNVLTEETSVVLLLHCVHNYSVSVTATSPNSKCSSQSQSLSVGEPAKQSIHTVEHCLNVTTEHLLNEDNTQKVRALLAYD